MAQQERDPDATIVFHGETYYVRYLSEESNGTIEHLIDIEGKFKPLTLALEQMNVVNEHYQKLLPESLKDTPIVTPGELV